MEHGSHSSVAMEHGCYLTVAAEYYDLGYFRWYLVDLNELNQFGGVLGFYGMRLIMKTITLKMNRTLTLSHPTKSSLFDIIHYTHRYFLS